MVYRKHYMIDGFVIDGAADAAELAEDKLKGMDNGFFAEALRDSITEQILLGKTSGSYGSWHMRLGRVTWVWSLRTDPSVIKYMPINQN